MCDYGLAPQVAPALRRLRDVQPANIASAVRGNSARCTTEAAHCPENSHSATSNTAENRRRAQAPAPDELPARHVPVPRTRHRVAMVVPGVPDRTITFALRVSHSVRRKPVGCRVQLCPSLVIPGFRSVLFVLCLQRGLADVV